MAFSYYYPLRTKKGAPVVNDALFTMGYNPDGRLGVGNTTDRSSPTLVGGGFANVSMGGTFTLAIKTNGSLFSWGSNTYGELGTGFTFLNYSSPVQVGAATDWSWIAASRQGVPCGFGIRGTPGSLYSWGQNFYGTLGLGDTTDRSSPTQIGAATDWYSVSACADTAYGIKNHQGGIEAGELYSWGRNQFGQLGVSDTTDRSSPVQVSGTSWAVISAGQYFAVAVIKYDDGGGGIIHEVWSWGRNNYGQLGHQNTTDQSFPVQISGFGANYVSAGQQHVLAIQAGGDLYSWGRNEAGQLGLNDTNNRSSPTLVGGGYAWAEAGGASSIAVKSDGTVWAWGSNTFGKLGLGDTTDRSSPVQIGTLTGWTSPVEFFNLTTFSTGIFSTGIINTQV